MRHVLVVKPCCLGDALMATPVLRALRTTYPDMTIDIAVTAWAAPAFDGHPAVRRLVPYPERPTLPRFFRLAQRLRAERYEAALGLDRSPWVGLLLWASGIPVRAGLAAGWRGLLYTHRVPPRPGRHESEQYLAVAARLGAVPRGLEPEFIVPEPIARAIRERVRHFRRPLVVIHPGGAINPGSRLLAKRWPPERFALVADHLTQVWGSTIILVGVATDRDATASVLAHARTPLIDWTDQLSWSELAALLAEADLFIGNDTGAGHLAAAVGTPTVSIFGPTSPLLYRPLGPKSVVIAPPASWELREPRDLRRLSTIADRLDISQVHVDQVVEAASRLLQGEQGTA